ncbi:MAG: dTMP kinase, partial [Candidatus Nitrosocosmicus sp.]
MNGKIDGGGGGGGSSNNNNIITKVTHNNNHIDTNNNKNNYGNNIKSNRQNFGTLIVVEGIDGSGKSTQIHLLDRWLRSKGYSVFFTEWNSSESVKE